MRRGLPDRKNPALRELRRMEIRNRWITFWFLVALAVIMACMAGKPALAAEPWYCKALAKYDRTCLGVQAAVKVFGRQRSEAFARKCGATDQDIEQARMCLKEPAK